MHPKVNDMRSNFLRTLRGVAVLAGLLFASDLMAQEQAGFKSTGSAISSSRQSLNPIKDKFSSILTQSSYLNKMPDQKSGQGELAYQSSLIQFLGNNIFMVKEEFREAVKNKTIKLD